LQLAKVCQKQGIVVCACGASVRIEWMLRSHEVAYSLQEEEEIKARYSACDTTIKSERLLLFFTIHEALQFCEHKLVLRNNQHELSPRDTFLSRLAQERRQPLSGVFGRILSSSPEEINILRAFDGQTYHSEHTYDAGEEIFRKGSESDCFNVVISGAVAVAIAKDDPRHGVYKNNMKIVSGAGPVQQKKSSSALMEPSIQDDHEIVVASVWPVGGVFGYVDFLLGRPRNFTAVATQDGTVVAKMSRRQIQTLQSENPELDGFLQRVLLQASLLDLANCTCDE
jgi:CRP-like cAMP-binding protein